MAMFTPGMRGMMVRDIQTVLKTAALYDGRLDGFYGPRTRDAVQQWQAVIGAKQDGKWGPHTLEQSLDYLARFNDMDAFAAGSDLVVPSMKGVYNG